jgi:hypothetical protein
MTRKREVIQQICNAVARDCKGVFGERMASLVLTGSAARGETTILRAGEGWRLVSDAEFLVVVLRETANDTGLASRVAQESARKLRGQGIDVAVDIAVVTARYFASLPKHIFSYELRTCGKIIAGDADILNSIPPFGPETISREDAWRLLCNRMIEQLVFVDDLERSTAELTPRLQYATVKLYLDMATSYLVFAGHYAPTYRERAERLSGLAGQRRSDTPFPLGKFAAHVAECTSWKISGEEQNCDGGAEFWHEAISYMRRLWRWEMIQMTHGDGELTTASLTKRLAGTQTAKQRLRGWLSIAKREGWIRGSARAPRWARLARHATPRYLVYQVAAEIAFRLPCLVKHKGQPPRLDLNWPELRNLLPEQAPRSSPQGAAIWRDVVSDVLWNYSHFVRNTLA